MIGFFASAQIVNIPDANFKAKLLNADVTNDIALDINENYIKIDVNNNGEIEQSEADLIYGLNINNSNIFDVTGINNFINLNYINISINNLTNLNLSGLNSLLILKANNNQIDTFITTSTILEEINLSYNSLTEFTFTSNNYIDGVYLNNNQITHIYSTVANVSIDSGLDLSYNQLFEESELNLISFIGDIGAHNMNISNNQFDHIDFTTAFHGEATLLIGNNNIDSISFLNNQPGNIICQTNNNYVDFGNFNSIQYCDSYESGNLTLLNCSNLEIINLKNGFDHLQTDCPTGFAIPQLSLIFQNTPSLKFICTDSAEMIYFQNLVNDLGLGNQIQVNDYCSFTPGGTFYEITGNIKYDFNSNGCDISDINYSNLNFSITDGTNTGSLIANQTGNYYITVSAGNHTLTPNIENPSYFNISPTSFSVDFPTQVSPFTQDFCVTANGVHSDVEIVLVPTSPARPSFDADYKLVYRNKGNQVENGTIYLTFDDARLDYVAANPVYNGSALNNFTWNYTNLQPFESREIDLILNVNSPMESPAVNNGDVLNYTTTITNANIDETPTDNTFTLDQTVVGSYDPNDKTCLEGTTITPSEVGKYVHYIIRFENTGTFPAENIVVKDLINLAKYDIATLVPLNSSHDFYTRINGNKVEFIFENINLDFNDATNDGYVAFKIKTKPTLVVGNTFSNNANIYFDYNFPITTNTYTTTVAALSTQDFDFGTYFTLYPNPAKDVLNIQTKQDLPINSIEIYNQLGQIVLAVTNTITSIDVTDLASGTYFVKINTEKGSTNAKFMKE